MWRIMSIFEILWVLAILPTLTYALTFEEAGLFVSEEIPLIGKVRNNSDDTYTLTSNGFPDNASGIFPNEDNPYSILEQDFSVTFPQNPIVNNQSRCLPASSIIGFAVNGVAIFSLFDEDSNDLNGVDFAGGCQGRTAPGGIYYFAQVPDGCSTFQRLESDQIFGVAIDGFPIYGPGKGEDKITNTDLDACHGKMVNGQYRYYMTDEWPYVLGCFRGTPMSVLNGNQVLTPSNVCKFACNKNAQSSEVLCADDFLIGLTEEEISIFTTADKSGESTRYLVNITSDAETITFKSKGPNNVTGNSSINGQTFFEHNFEVIFPKILELLTKAECLPSSGIIGFASNGVPLLSHFDNDRIDININGTFDSCNGQINNNGLYHYTQTRMSQCVSENPTESELYGVAMDGFPIYTTGDTNITNSDLDVCHGRLESNNQYRYYVTKEFPYILGCFRGTPQELKINGTLTIQNSDDCLYACNVNGTTPEADITFCDSTEQNFIFYIIVGVTGFVAFVLLVLILVCTVKCLRQNKCCCCGEKEDDVQYHL